MNDSDNVSEQQHQDRLRQLTHRLDVLRVWYTLPRQEAGTLWKYCIRCHRQLHINARCYCDN